MRELRVFWSGVFIVLVSLQGIHAQTLPKDTVASVSYELKDALDFDAGTVEFWFCPQFSSSDYFTDSGEYRGVCRLLTFVGDSGKPEEGGKSLNIFHYVRDSSGSIYVKADPFPENAKSWAMKCPNFEKGKWHHFSFVWEKQHWRVYLDGELISERDVPIMLKDYFAENLQIKIFLGAGPGAKTPPMIIDELRISSKALEPDKTNGSPGGSDASLVLVDTFESINEGLTKPSIHKGHGTIGGKASVTQGKQGSGILLGAE